MHISFKLVRFFFLIAFCKHMYMNISKCPKWGQKHISCSNVLDTRPQCREILYISFRCTILICHEIWIHIKWLCVSAYSRENLQTSGNNGEYHLIIYTKSFLDNFFSVIRSGNKLCCTMWRGKKWSHVQSRAAIFTFDVNASNIVVSPTLTTNSSSKAFGNQRFFPQLQVHHQVNVCHFL